MRRRSGASLVQHTALSARLGVWGAPGAGAIAPARGAQRPGDPADGRGRQRPRSPSMPSAPPGRASGRRAGGPLRRPIPTAHVLAVGETLTLPVRLLGQAEPGAIVVSPEGGAPGGRLGGSGGDGRCSYAPRIRRACGGLCGRRGKPGARDVGRTSASDPQPLGRSGTGTDAAGRHPRAGQGWPGTGRESGRGSRHGQVTAAQRVSPAPHRAARPICRRTVPGVRELGRPICPS